MRLLRILTAAVGLALVLQAAAPAQTKYTMKEVAKFGDKVGDAVIKTDAGDFEIGTLNDAGQICFVTETEAGGEMLVQYTDGKLIPVVLPNGPAPSGTWAEGLGVNSPVSMNQLGNIVFAANLSIGGAESAGTFIWDLKAQKITAVALKGSPAVNNLVFESGGDFAPSINNLNDAAFVASVKNSAGEVQLGVFLYDHTGKLQPVVVPDQEVAGAKVNRARYATINDAGVVGVHVRRAGDTRDSGYVWENGTLTKVAAVGEDAPGGGKITWVSGLRLNNANRNVVLGARLDDQDNGPWGLYLLADGKLKQVAAPGQDMPGGGKLKSLRSDQVPHYSYNVAATTGEAAFVGTLEDDTNALYRMAPDGTVSLVLKAGDDSPLGKLLSVGPGEQSSIGVGINGKGQIAVPVLPDGGVDTIVLLTPQ